MNTTNIVRIPGVFTLPSGWPKVEVSDLTTGLFAHYVAADLSGVGNNGEVAEWPSRTGLASLTIPSPARPQWRDLGGGRSNASFIATGPQWLHSEPILRPRTGPVTIIAAMRFAPYGTGQTRHRVITTSAAGSGWYGISAIQESNVITMETQNAGEIRGTLPADTYAVVVAVYDGANSSLTINGISTTGTINTTSSQVAAVRLASNSSGTQPLNGRIFEARLYDRAFNAAEIRSITAELRTTHGF